MATPTPLLAAEFKLIPGLTLSEELTDNVHQATNSRQSDHITTVAPSLQISSATERSLVTLSTGVSWLRYANNKDLNALDYSVQSGLNYQFDPRLSVSLGASYVQNSRSDRTDLNGLTLQSGSERQNYRVSGDYAVSEKSTSTISYVYSNETFVNPAEISTTNHTVNVSQDYDLDRYSRQTKLVGNFGYFRNFTDTSLVDNYTVSMGLTKKIHELWHFSLMAGGRFTHSVFDNSTQITPTQVVSFDDTGWVGNFSINYSGERTNSSLAFNNDVTPASGRDGATLRTGVAATLKEKFTKDLSGSIDIWYSWNRSNQNQYSAQAIDEKNLTLSGGLQYKFSNYASLEGNYRFSNIYYSQTLTQANVNVVMLRLNIRQDLMDF
jgi:hypothetical protein